ncbi:MAG: Na+/H+ antiporter NhaA, partial [Gammaproteobacteria bacterium]|nr:Na+/H+ antiporter NhaA [Gammaproteobacteria bacterium]
ALILAGIGTISLLIMNRLKVARITAYALVGIAIWVFVLKSGVHATLAGIIVALSIPLKNTKDNTSPLRQLEHSLHPWVAYMILPLFAFANAGVSLTGIGDGVLFGSVSLGIAAGLFIGKQAGVFLSVWLAIKLKLARMPSNGTWGALYGVSLLTGIGFTMSLFIGTLAFEHGGFDYSASTRVGVLIGSTLSAIAGYLVLRFSLPQSQTTTNRNPLSATFRGEQI